VESVSQGYGYVGVIDYEQVLQQYASSDTLESLTRKNSRRLKLEQNGQQKKQTYLLEPPKAPAGDGQPVIKAYEIKLDA
jgi:hypothetical protein